ncbi:MAG: GNAT family N-acetyltransferase [Desulforhabdus sp.]|jgi:CelD/BcsL family acetyltransferase involved in cellulose biosynthesis|nr:GNAT family N-acetyltransferase [Desulforhabdus sp.]
MTGVTDGQVSIVGLEALSAVRQEHGSELQWSSPFVLPAWLKAWWSVFGHATEPLIAIIRQGQGVIGAAPLMVRDGVVQFLGSPEVCDYFDCPIIPGKERFFFEALFAHLSAMGLKNLELGPVRSDSTILRALSGYWDSCAPSYYLEQQDVYVELDLPGTWDEFLDLLDGKQRHELRRKLRRLQEAGAIRFRRIEGGSQLPQAIETFLGLFTKNRKDKAAFMTGRMASFFGSLAAALAEEGLLRLFILDVEKQPVASIFCFDHQGTRYLYNSGYDIAFQRMSVGLMSKVLSIQSAIEERMRTYSFLKGNEPYKYRLGGKEARLLKCAVSLD